VYTYDNIISARGNTKQEDKEMIRFPEVIERENTITVDGYSDRKTFAGAVRDFGRYIEKHFRNGEGDAIISIVNDGIDEFNQVIVPAKESGNNGYFFEVDEVECASYIDEETDETKYGDGHFYLVMRFMK
jgi:hypothetical protein